MPNLVIVLYCHDGLEEGIFGIDLKELGSLMEQARAVVDQAVAEAEIADDGCTSTISTISSEYIEDEDFEIDHEIALNIESLKDLAATIESNLIDSERRIKDIGEASIPAFIVSKPAQGYVSHVRDRYPRAPARLIERLGEANWQRHIVVRGRMEKSAALASEKYIPQSQSVLFSDFKPVSMFHDSGLGTTVSAASRYAASAASHTSFISSIAEKRNNSIRVPPTPMEVDVGKPFRCSICGLVQTKIKNRVEWKYVLIPKFQMSKN